MSLVKNFGNQKKNNKLIDKKSFNLIKIKDCIFIDIIDKKIFLILIKIRKKKLCLYI